MRVGRLPVHAQAEPAVVPRGCREWRQAQLLQAATAARRLGGIGTNGSVNRKRGEQWGRRGGGALPTRLHTGREHRDARSS